jgi:hypothetical protein
VGFFTLKALYEQWSDSARSVCTALVRCRQNIAATINMIFLLLLLSPLVGIVTILPEGVVLGPGSEILNRLLCHKNIRIPPKPGVYILQKYKFIPCHLDGRFFLKSAKKGLKLLKSMPHPFNY